MDSKSTALWEDSQAAATAQSLLERHAWRRNFLVVFALVALTVAVAVVAARMGGPS